MNVCFYTAIDRLALGTVAAIEFLPVIALAALGARTPRNLAALALAVPGVYLLTDVQLAAQPLGLAFAFANAGLFALYIVLADRVAKRDAIGGIDGLAASMVIAAVVVTPMGGWQAIGVVADPVALLAGIGVGVASSVIPYVCDQLALARLRRAPTRCSSRCCRRPRRSSGSRCSRRSRRPPRPPACCSSSPASRCTASRAPADAEPLTRPRAAPPAATPTPARSAAPAAASRS